MNVSLNAVLRGRLTNPADTTDGDDDNATAAAAAVATGYSHSLLVELQYSHLGLASSHFIRSRLQLKQPVLDFWCDLLVRFILMGPFYRDDRRALCVVVFMLLLLLLLYNGTPMVGYEG